MGDYTLHVKVDQHWISNFNKHNMKLCFSTGMVSGSEINYNVVAFTSTIAANITISWRDSFSIAASKDSFSNGAKFTAATTISTINFGQTYTLPSDWTDKRPNTDTKAPKAGFRFTNEAEASAVVYKQINGMLTPIYISAAGPLPPGHEDLTPKAACRIWFSNNAETATMISDFQSSFLEIDLTGNTEASCEYDATGTWLNM